MKAHLFTAATLGGLLAACTSTHQAEQQTQAAQSQAAQAQAAAAQPSAAPSKESKPVEAKPVAAKSVPAGVYALKTRSLEGQDVALSQYMGKVTLVVNVASQCGYTPQYTGLEALQQQYQARGFSVLGFPSGDFGGQEFDSAQEIRAFCDSKYHVTFPLFEKCGVKAGATQSPVYAHLNSEAGALPRWNFGKYLIGRDGKVIKFFDTKVAPDAAELKTAIEAAL